jgi:hypothetical protein
MRRVCRQSRWNHARRFHLGNDLLLGHQFSPLLPLRFKVSFAASENANLKSQRPERTAAESAKVNLSRSGFLLGGLFLLHASAAKELRTPGQLFF